MAVVLFAAQILAFVVRAFVGVLIEGLIDTLVDDVLRCVVPPGLDAGGATLTTLTNVVGKAAFDKDGVDDWIYGIDRIDWVYRIDWVDWLNNSILSRTPR